MLIPILKAFKITGITDPAYTAYKTNGALIVVAPVGSNGNPSAATITSLNNQTLNFTLYGEGNVPWTGSGTYELWLFDSNNTNTATTIWKAASVDISTAEITVTWTNLPKLCNTGLTA
jgi:hypothetical protein